MTEQTRSTTPDGRGDGRRPTSSRSTSTTCPAAPWPRSRRCSWWPTSPSPAVRLATVLALPTARVEALLDELAAEYRGENGGRPRGFEVRRVGDGWRIYSAPVYADVVGRFVLEGQTARLTQAALETLAVIAYRQPVTRGQVSAVRGVNVDGVVRTLTTRGLVAEVGTDPSSGAVLYQTTGYFLERMGLSSLDEMPPLAPYLPDIDAFDGVDQAIGDNR